MQETILDVLARGTLMISDGAMGTLLYAQGLSGGMLPEAWNLERPEAVIAGHRAYLEAGAQIVTTNTIGGNRPHLSDAGLGERTVEINRVAGQLAREAVGQAAWVAGSIGSTGRLLEPYGPLPLAEAERAFAEQAIALAEGGVDFILVETQNDVEEACAAVRMAHAHTALPVFCTFAFNIKGRTLMGQRPEMAAQRAEEAGAVVVGANCGEGPQAVLAALEKMCRATTLPVMAQPNAGIPQLGERGETIWDVLPEQLAEQSKTFVALGARIIGGCCGTTPAHIAAIAAALR